MKSFEIRESVTFQNEGQKIFGVIHRPLIAKPYPIILICHGLGGHKTGKYRLYVLLAELLTQVGMGCLRIDFRGSGDSEGNFADMTIKSEISDALVALNFLKQDASVDSARIGIFGRSCGGLVAVAAAQQFGFIKSLGLWAPVFSGDQWRERWASLAAQQLTEEAKDKYMRINGLLPGLNFYDQLFKWQMEPILSSLAKLPILHIHGEQDDLVDLTHADSYQKMRAAATGRSQFLRLPKSDHDLSDPVEQLLALTKTVEWFQQTLM